MDQKEIIVLLGFPTPYFDIGDKVIFWGEEDEIEGYTPLWLNSYVDGKLIKEPAGVGYNLKIRRQTVLLSEIRAVSPSMRF